jgi:hypothetical protein
MRTALDREHIIWSDGTREMVNTILFATGYRPHLGYLRALGALTDGLPQHARGHLHHASRSGLRRHRVPTFVRVEHPPGRAPRRGVHRARHRGPRTRRGRPRRIVPIVSVHKLLTLTGEVLTCTVIGTLE